MKISNLIKTLVARINLIHGKTMPLRIAHFITTRCNLSCSFCGCNKMLYTEMGCDEIKEAMLAFNKLGTFAWGFTGGEPFLRNDLPELLKFAKSLDFYTSVVTNGILIEKIKKTSCADIDFIMVSFHGKEDRAKSICGEKHTNKVFETIDFLSSRKFNTCLSSTFDENSLDDMKYTIEYAKSKNIYCSFEPIFDFATQAEDKGRVSNPAILKKLINNVNFLIEQKKKKAPIWNSLSYLEWVKNYGRPNNFYCYAGKLYATLMPDGILRRCPKYGNEEKSGNYGYDFKKLNSEPHKCYCYPWCHVEYSRNFSLHPATILNTLKRL
ncbi:MAG: radical SAM protein [Candidatus Omnitrophota bacterium]